MSEPADPSAARENALVVLRRLREAGHVAYFAGGCVRDLLLGWPPKDFDVATSATPDEVRNLFPRTQAVGAAFGVILVRQSKSVIEVATFRSDGNYSDGRRPDAVHFTSPKEDAQRRDFTINGLFSDPVEDRVIDYVGGQADLAARQIRAIGDPVARFHEDHLRILRAVRFASRLDFTIEAATAQAITREAKNLARISPERIAEELRKMLTPITRLRAATCLDELQLLPVLLRFVSREQAAPPQIALTVFQTLATLNPSAISFGLALAALLLDWQYAGQPLRTRVEPTTIKQLGRVMRQTLRISNEELDDLVGSLSFWQLLSDEPPRLAVLRRFLAQPLADHALLVMRSINSTTPSPALTQALERLTQLAGHDHSPLPLVTGDDLTAAGYSPGPAFKRVLDAVYDEQLEDRITDRASALAFAGRLLK